MLSWGLNGNSSSQAMTSVCQCIEVTLLKWIRLRTPHCFNSSLPGQNGHHFTDVIFKCIFMNEKFCILIWIALELVPKDPIDSESILVWVMAWHRIAWWCHQIETFSTVLALCVGNSLVTGQFPTQRPVTRSFDVFFDLHLNDRLSKQPWGWWYEMPSPPLWRHNNGPQAITWTNVDPVHWRIYAALGEDELTHCCLMASDFS